MFAKLYLIIHMLFIAYLYNINYNKEIINCRSKAEKIGLTIGTFLGVSMFIPVWLWAYKYLLMTQ